MKPVELDENEVATVMAALRYWQENIRYPDRDATMPEYFVEARSLDNSEIDELCERLTDG